MAKKSLLTQELINLCKQRMEPYHCEGFLFGGGDLDAPILFVGEAPGRQELIDDRPFTGKAGNVLNQYLDWLGLEKDDVYITSVVKSRPYKHSANLKDKPIHQRGNRTPNQAEIRAHAPLLDAFIHDLSPRIIITLGGIALRRLTPIKGKLIDLHGQPLSTPLLKLKSLDQKEYIQTEELYTVFPTFHPASVFYNQRLNELIKQDMLALRKLIKKGESRKKPVEFI